MTAKLVFAALLVTPLLALAGETPKDDFSYQPPDKAEMEAMQKRWMETIVPGKWHRRLDYFLGKWDTSTSTWMGGTGSSEAMRSKGTAEFRWLVDGRWLWMEGKGDWMGQQMTNYGITGYDNFRHRYVSVFVDNLSTAMNSASGLLSQSGNEMIEYGTIDEPMNGEVGKNVKYITRITDDDHFAYEIHDLGIGEANTKVIQIDYTRRR
ncbi:MAG: DUF1579 family protein [Candidatus Eisenbacteria bacterium]